VRETREISTVQSERGKRKTGGKESLKNAVGQKLKLQQQARGVERVGGGEREVDTGTNTFSSRTHTNTDRAKDVSLPAAHAREGDGNSVDRGVDVSPSPSLAPPPHKRFSTQRTAKTTIVICCFANCFVNRKVCEIKSK